MYAYPCVCAHANFCVFVSVCEPAFLHFVTRVGAPIRSRTHTHITTSAQKRETFGLEKALQTISMNSGKRRRGKDAHTHTNTYTHTYIHSLTHPHTHTRRGRKCRNPLPLSKGGPSSWPCLAHRVQSGQEQGSTLGEVCVCACVIISLCVRGSAC